MHLTLIISSLNAGGAERVLSELANHWARNGYKVSLVTLAPAGSLPFYPLDQRVDLHQLNKSGAEPSAGKRLKKLVARIYCLRKLLKVLNPDIIISFMDMVNLTVLLSCFNLKIPVIVSERTHPAYHRLPALYSVLRKILYKMADKVVVQTSSAASYFKNLTSVEILPNAVAIPTPIKQDFNTFVKNIISTGRLCPYKGFDTLIRAFANLIKIHPQLNLTIYGEGQERHALEQLIQSLHLADKVHLPGTTKNIYEALAAADLFIFPSRYEGFPNALCEAMAVGLPVIASDCSGSRDIVREGIDGRLFPVGDEAALTRLALELLDDAGQRQRLAQNAQAICERFDAARIFALWDEVVLKAKAR